MIGLKMARTFTILSFLATGLVLGSATSLDECRHEIVESMPELMEFKNPINFKPTLTHEALLETIRNTKSSLRIASFYLTLTAEPEFHSHPSTVPGKEILDAIVDAVKNRGVNLEVVLDKSNRKEMNNQEDVKTLEAIGVVKYLNMRQLLKAGVLHTKFLISDNETFYVGSSNFDWRSYTQIKEIGIKFENCPTLAQDMDKIFQTYMFVSELGRVPDELPAYLNTTINIDKPFHVKLANLNVKTYLAGSPPAFNGLKQWNGRTSDIDGVLSTINKAKSRVDISVMNYSPRVEFGWPKKYWPRIDDALRKAAVERNVHVRLLVSEWSQSRDDELMWYRSLNALQSPTFKGSVHVKLFKVPAYDEFQKSVPYARVKHDKYMVTDNGLYIGTSNWAADYFINTCGIGVVIEPVDGGSTTEGSIIQNMQDLFERDFNSEFSREL